MCDPKNVRFVPKTVRRFITITALLIAALLPVRLHAQSSTGSATLAGAVLDPSSKAVVDAAIVVRHEVSGDIKTAVTDGAGHFSVPGLPPGAYSIEVAVPGFDIVRRSGIELVAGRSEEISIALTVANVTETVTVSAALPTAAVAAPSQASLTARSAVSLISNEYIRNYTSPISDYSQVLLMAPGTYSVAANGVGLGDTKTYYRGFKDGQYNMTFDGIPFNDTNDPTHHSWVFFPAQTIGSTVFDRSPGSAATLGPATYGGTVNLLSRGLVSDQLIQGSIAYGTWNTRMFDLEYNSGRMGASGKSRLIIDAHDMRSDGYQTYNDQRREAFSAKYQYALNDNSMITAFSTIMELHSNTPNQKAATRAQIQQYGDNFLNSGDPTSPLYYKFNFYRIPTDFEYGGFRTLFGNGWSIDDKAYTMRYYNHQNYNGLTSITTTSATDKLNSYRKWGNILPVTYVSNLGVFRTGLWSEYASTDRFQTPSDPRTWIDAALPNFHEKFGTTTLQPYAEYELKVGPALTIAPGVKLSYYKQNFTQFADNGKTVGNLNGAPYVQHAAEYHTWLPSLDAHYLVQSFWSVYGQYGKGQTIPPTSVFDVGGANVSILPKPVTTDTFQVGSVWKSNRATLDVDFYHIRFQNPYSTNVDPVTGDTVYYLTADSVTRGFEAESTLLVGGGLAVYLNGTVGTAKYTDTDQWVQNAPSDTQTIGLTYNRASWNVGFFNKRVGQQWNDNGSAHQAVVSDPFNITNLFVNYTLRGGSKLSQSRLRFAVNNLTDSHAITAITPASTKSNLPAPGDLLSLMPGRSVSVSISVGYSPGGRP
ncbi:MAG TPA: TonB-dependent receptor [Vicinamibacterales bacterium]|nr:TonB-dependent receptor [Vicinamibacterales bacterium]